MLPFLRIEIPEFGDAESFQHVSHLSSVLRIVVHELKNGRAERLTYSVMVDECFIEPLRIPKTTREIGKGRLKAFVSIDQRVERAVIWLRRSIVLNGAIRHPARPEIDDIDPVVERFARRPVTDIEFPIEVSLG